MFCNGDRVVHPGHGGGVIKEIRCSDALDGFDQYYVIEFFANRLTVMIPLEKADDVGLRLADPDMLDRALGVINERPNHLPSDFKVRQKELTEKLKSGDTCLVAEVYRDLSWRSRAGHLTSTDARVLEEARNLLATEFAAVRGCEADEAIAEVSSLLGNALEQWTVTV